MLIKDASIIDIKTGKIADNQVVIIKNGEVVNVGSAATLSKYKAKQTISAKGKFVMPALWDMHVHFGGGDSLI